MKLLRDPLFLLLACFALGWGVYQGGQPPKRLPESAPQSVFSAGRAKLILKELYHEGLPHVSGSAQNAILRDRIVGIFERFGYDAEVQKRFHCKADFGRCSPVENILAIRPSTKSENLILVAAHYDSSWAGAGVADDGAGVATVLEIARLAAQQPEFSNGLAFLLTDGEEQGLIGADAFVSYNDAFGRVRAVINLEARGVSGPSIMFETGANNRGVIRLLAKNVDYPVANSLAYEMYRHMPNDTDFSVFKAKGLPGVNFAFTGDAAAYHSQIDDLNHLDMGSLQHHGDNAWSMVLALDERNLDRLTSSEDAAYIDLFGKRLVHYPLSSAPGIALVLSVLVLVAIRRVYSRQSAMRQIFWAALTVIAMALALPLAGWLLSWPLGRWVDNHQLAHPFPWLGRATLMLAVVWIVSRLLRFLASRASTGSVMTACWGIFALMSLALAMYFPVASYIAALPLFGFTLGLALDAFRWKENPRLLFASLLGFLFAVYIGLYYFFQLDILLNFSHSEVKIIPLLIPAIALLPLMSGYYEGREAKGGFLVLLLIVVLGLATAQRFIPAYTPQTPRDMNLVYRQDLGLAAEQAGTGTSQDPAWLVLESPASKPAPEFAAEHGFKSVSLVAPDGEMRDYTALATTALDLPDIRQIGVVKRVGEEGEAIKGNSGDQGSGQNHRFVIELQVPAVVQALGFRFPAEAGLSRAWVDGQLGFDRSLQTARSWPNPGLTINHPPAGRHRFEFEFDVNHAVEMTVSARYELPASVVEPYLVDWPENAQPAYLGQRALKNYRFTLGADPAPAVPAPAPVQTPATTPATTPQANTR